MHYPTLNILESTIQDGSQLDSTKVTPSLPAVPPIQCGSPPGWVGYIVQAGDTLWAISIRTGESVEALQTANCLKKVSLIYVGQQLSVPHLQRGAAPTPTTTTKIPTLTPTETPKPTGVPSPIPTEPPPEPTLEPPRATPTLAPTSIPSGEG